MKHLLAFLISCLLLHGQVMFRANNGIGTGAAPCTSTISLISGTNVQNGGSASAETAPPTGSVDTSTATFLFCPVAYYTAAATPTFADNRGNTYLAGAAFTDATGAVGVIPFYDLSPSVGTGHTFTVSTGSFMALGCAAFKGIPATISIDGVIVGTNNGSGTSISGGTVAPSACGDLILTSVGMDAATGGVTVPAGFSLLGTVEWAGSTNFGLSYAYQVQLTQANVTPSWGFVNPIHTAATSLAVK